ncbi:MAG: hypothetical protein MK180_06785 [Rhodobacteraceae bacterium]|nr:hypothetical protein [Paracoccaceae bacterium]
MKTFFAVLGLAALPITAQAQDIDPDVDFTRLNKSGFVKEMRAMGEASWEPMMALYGRLDPSLAELVPEYPWSSEFDDAYGCVYQGLSDRDALGDVNQIRDKTILLVGYIMSSEEVNFASLENDDTLLELMLPSDNLVEVSSDCGVQELNMRALTESGMMEAFMAVVMADG